jgi:hypothetical protein
MRHNQLGGREPSSMPTGFKYSREGGRRGGKMKEESGCRRGVR